MLRGYGERRVRFLVGHWLQSAVFGEVAGPEGFRMRFSVRPNSKPRFANPRATHPAAWRGGLLERICPVETFSIVPRSLAGGCPTPPGRRDVTEKRILASGRHGKAHSGHGSSRKGAFYEPRTNQTALFREAPWAVWIVVDLGRRLPVACLSRPKFHLDRTLCSERK